MCWSAIPPGVDQGKLKQENRMKTLSKWLMATSLSIISFVVLVMLYAQITDKYLFGKPQGCWEISCS